jgi:hypothetical protein
MALVYLSYLTLIQKNSAVKLRNLKKGRNNLFSWHFFKPFSSRRKSVGGQQQTTAIPKMD